MHFFFFFFFLITFVHSSLVLLVEAKEKEGNDITHIYVRTHRCDSMFYVLIFMLFVGSSYAAAALLFTQKKNNRKMGEQNETEQRL